MKINEVLELLNEKTNNEFGFALGKASLHENTCNLEIIYNDGTILGPNKRNEFQIFLLEKMPEGFIYNIKFIKNYKTGEAIKRSVDEIISKNFPALLYSFKSFNDETNSVIIEVDEFSYDYALTKNVAGKIANELNQAYLNEFVVNIERVENNDVDQSPVIYQAEPIIEHKISVSDVMAFCGEEIKESPGYIADYTAPQAGVTLCGKIKYINSREYVSKRDKEREEAKKKENEERGEENVEAQSEEKPYVKKLFKFEIEDFSGQMHCIYFSNKSTLANAEKLEAGSEVLVYGDVVEDSFSGGLSLKVKQINLCVLPKKVEETITFKEEPENYTWVFPEPYVDKKQVDLFSMMSGEAQVSDYLAQNDIVVFDFETTGLSASDCFIVEIGAVKVHNGKITEMFETFVNPEKHIDDDATAVHGITDEMVKDAPTYPKALQDFYKFTRNATLVAYNISFDYSFLDLYGKKAGFNFDNPQIDALKLASKNVHGVKNYKLKTVAEKLGVVLDNAHRAVYDTIATAEVFIKLADNINLDGTIK